MPVIWSQENDQRLIKAIWDSPSRAFTDIGKEFFGEMPSHSLLLPMLTNPGHPVKNNTGEYMQIMRRIHKLIGKDDSNGTAKASKSPKGIQKKKSAPRRRKSSTPSEPDTDVGFDESAMFSGDKHSSSGMFSAKHSCYLSDRS